MAISMHLRAFGAVIVRDLLLAFRHKSELVNSIAFFILVVSLFPLGVGADIALLRKIAPGVIWVAALLATFLSLDHLFRSDYEDGCLELILMSPHPVSLIVLAKIMAHWILTGVPLTLIAPLLAGMYGLENSSIAVLMLTLLIGTPILSLIGAIAIALTVGLRKGGVMLALLILPFYVPVLIFATAAIDAQIAGFPVSGQINMLLALLALALTLSPWPTAVALKMSLS